MFLSFQPCAWATDPWFTGPYLAQFGLVSAIGDGYFSISGVDNNSPGYFDINQVFINSPRVSRDNFFLVLNYGLGQDIEATWVVNYQKNQTNGVSSDNLGDVDISLGFQILRQNDNKWPPNFKISLTESLPSGRYDGLNYNLYGTDATGNGSYITSLGLNFQHLAQLNEDHYLSSYATIQGSYPANTAIQGYSIYGGTASTQGRIAPGSFLAVDLAAEFNLTQNWGAVFELFALAQKASSFHGKLGGQGTNIRKPEFGSGKPHVLFNRLIPSINNIGSSTIGSGNASYLSLSPGIEYNFSSNAGILGGAWFTFDGKNAPNFLAPFIEFVVSW